MKILTIIITIAAISTAVFAQEVEKITVVECCEKNVYPEKYINVSRAKKIPFTQKNIHFYFDAAMLLYMENEFPFKTLSSFDVSNVSVELGAKIGGGYFWDSTILGLEFENVKSSKKEQYQSKRRSAGLFVKDFQYNDEYSSYLKYSVNLRDSERILNSYSLTEELLGLAFEANYTYNLFSKLYMGITVGAQLNMHYNYNAKPSASIKKDKKDFGTYQGYEYWFEIPFLVRVSRSMSLSLINRYKKYEVAVSPDINGYPMLFVPTKEYSSKLSLNVKF